MVKAIQIQHDERMENTLALAKKAGYEYVSIGFGSSLTFHSDGWKKEIDRIKSLLNSLGLKCALTHLPYHNLTLNSNVVDEVMDEAIKTAKNYEHLGIKFSINVSPKHLIQHTHSRFIVKNDSVDE